VRGEEKGRGGWRQPFLLGIQIGPISGSYVHYPLYSVRAIKNLKYVGAESKANTKKHENGCFSSDMDERNETAIGC